QKGCERRTRTPTASRPPDPRLLGGRGLEPEVEELALLLIPVYVDLGDRCVVEPVCRRCGEDLDRDSRRRGAQLHELGDGERLEGLRRVQESWDLVGDRLDDPVLKEPVRTRLRVVVRVTVRQT